MEDIQDIQDKQPLNNNNEPGKFGEDYQDLNTANNHDEFPLKNNYNQPIEADRPKNIYVTPQH
jgi:hypothetical protein